MSRPARLAAWIDREQEGLLLEITAEAGVDLVAAGGPDSTRAMDFASLCGIAGHVDQRALIQAEADVLLLASADTPDADRRRLVRATATKAFSLEPLPGVVVDLQAEPDDARTAAFCPAFTRSPGFLAARDALDDFGSIEAMSIVCRSSPTAGSCFARLYDGLALATSLCGPPEFIHASLVSPHGAVPDTLDGLSGHVAATLAFGGERCATLLASNQAQTWARGVTLIGSAGCLEIDDGGYRHAAGGAVVDDHGEREPESIASLVGRQIRRFVEHGESHAPVPDHAAVLAQCEAARLSCRTCQPESPVTIADMLRSL